MTTVADLYAKLKIGAVALPRDGIVGAMTWATPKWLLDVLDQQRRQTEIDAFNARIALEGALERITDNMSTIPEIRASLDASVRGLGPYRVFTDRPHRLVIVVSALRKIVDTTQARRDNEPQRMPSVRESEVFALVEVAIRENIKIALGVELVVCYGACWISRLRRPLPLMLMSSSRLGELSVLIDQQLEAFGRSPELSIALDADVLQFWQEWQGLVLDESRRRFDAGEPDDPVLDAHETADDAKTIRDANVEAVVLDVKPPQTRDMPTMSKSGNTHRGATAPRPAGGRFVTGAEAGGTAEIAIDWAARVDGAGLAAAARNAAHDARAARTAAQIARYTNDAFRAGLGSEMGIDLAEITELRQLVADGVINLSITSTGFIEATPANREIVRRARAARIFGRVAGAALTP